MNIKINSRFEVNIDLIYGGDRYSVEVIDHERESVQILDFTFTSKKSALAAANGYIHAALNNKLPNTDPLEMAERISYLESEIAHSGYHDGWVLKGLKDELKKLKGLIK
tara:strand:- start:120 stop:446 length:327 start_codon:yes stop_codon:yes gene_type:complete